VYIGSTDSLIKESYDVRVSADGGITWQNAPTSGIPANQEMLTRVFGTLSDDSIVEVYADTSVQFHGDDISAAFTFYAWRMGDAKWRRVAPSLTALINSDSQFLATQTDRLWTIADNHDSTQADERVYSFAA